VFQLARDAPLTNENLLCVEQLQVVTGLFTFQVVCLQILVHPVTSYLRVSLTRLD
jgi:hypothetical protein